MSKALLWLGSSLILPFALTAPTVAQSITAAPDSTGTIIHHQGNTYHIQGGTQAGANLFHSFQALGLSSGEIANFLSSHSVTNILGRVTGGDPSIIEGLIQITGANSNLYLMNPAGFVFGAGGSLNVGGDFFATTADRIAVGDGWFMSTGVNDYASLVGTPNQFAFASEEPGTILNFGELSASQNVSLIGGTVLNGGTINGATVTLAAVPGERLVRVSQTGMLLSLDVPTAQMAVGITPVDLPTLLTGSETLTNRSAAVPAASINSGDVVIAAEVSGQQVDLYASGQVTPTDANLVQGDVWVVRFSESGENPDQTVFINRRADHPEDLLYGAEAGTISQIIESDEDGVAVVSEQLSMISDSVGKLKSVAIVAEGHEGYFGLGNQWIEAETIGDHATQLQAWGDALTESADLLLYSCFTALGETGQALIDSMASLTGADVAASTNATGSTNYGGDWFLEASTGSIESSNPLSFGILADWDGKLLIRRVTDFTDGGGANTLRSLIGIALDGDTILFDSPGQTVTLGGTEIAWGTDNLTIDGNGGTVDGGGNSRIFNISANNATIQNLTLSGGRANGDAGGIFSSGNVTLNNSMISGNLAVVRGGGIRAIRDITLNNSTISGNSSGQAGGGIFSDQGDVTLNNSTVSANLSGSAGGGIVARKIYGNGGDVTLNNSTVSGNSSISDGGGIRGYGNVNLSNSIVSGNTSALKGGGIVAYADINLNNSIIANNSASDYGGGIASFAGEISLSNSTISGNLSALKGGGIHGQRLITLDNSTLSGNSAPQGGGIWNLDRLTAINFTDDLNLDLYARNSVNLSGSGSITVTGSIQTNGNPLTINAATTLNTTALTLDTSSNTGGGDITLTAGNNLTTRNLITAAPTSGNSGNVSLTSTNGSINTLSGGGTGAINTTTADGNSGTVTMKAPQGIVVGSINTEAINGAGGAITLESESFVQVQGELTAADSFFNSFAASISSAGKTAGGSILIRHGGNALTPFVVGDASTNGTSAAITAGTGFTIFPTNAYLLSHSQPGIQILTNNAGAGIAIDVAGSEPINQYLDTEAVIRRIGNQAGGKTFFDAEGNYTWDLPGEAAFGGSLDDNIILQEFLQLDGFMTSNFQAVAETSTDLGAEDSSEEDSSEQSSVAANIHDTFSRIQEQTGTVPALIYALSQPDALELIVVTPDNQLLRKVVPEADRTTLQRTFRAFRRRITSVSRSYQAPAQQLYDWFIRPIESSIENLDVDTLIFAMGEGLRAIPISALHDGEQFLIQKYSLGQIPSLSLTNSSYVPLQDANVLAMGASQFNQLSPLPAVPTELAAIAQNQPGEQYLNQQFTWDNLATQSRERNFEIVHLATHAAFRPGDVQNAYIQLWGDDQIDVQRLRELRWFEDPTVELLVLSACETAFGDPYAELGFAGLAVQSGVKSALASLWQVSDLGTLVLMNEFYDALARPEVTIKAEALRQAQLALLQGEASIQDSLIGDAPLPPELAQYANTDLSHPYYWSAFTLVGSPW